MSKPFTKFKSRERTQKFKRHSPKVHGINLRNFISEYGMPAAISTFKYSKSALHGFLTEHHNVPEWLDNKAKDYLDRYRELRLSGRAPEITPRDLEKPDAFAQTIMSEFPNTVMGIKLREAFEAAQKVAEQQIPETGYATTYDEPMEEVMQEEPVTPSKPEDPRRKPALENLKKANEVRRRNAEARKQKLAEQRQPTQAPSDEVAAAQRLKAGDIKRTADNKRRAVRMLQAARYLVDLELTAACESGGRHAGYLYDIATEMLQDGN